jgi:hypothetical protein
MNQNEKRVYLVQCLCPAGHCILAAAFVGDGAAERQRIAAKTLQGRIPRLVAKRRLNPWCGICHAALDDCRFAVGPTIYRTWADVHEAVMLLAHQIRKAAAN